jgi:hypothetical protein
MPPGPATTADIDCLARPGGLPRLAASLLLSAVPLQRAWMNALAGAGLACEVLKVVEPKKRKP